MNINILIRERILRFGSLLLLASFAAFLVPTQLPAYTGLCCGKCGGNMPLNIMGAGVPETCEFRIKASTTYRSFSGLREGDKDRDGEELLLLPTSGSGNFMFDNLTLNTDLDSPTDIMVQDHTVQNGSLSGMDYAMRYLQDASAADEAVLTSAEETTVADQRAIEDKFRRRQEMMNVHMHTMGAITGRRYMAVPERMRMGMTNINMGYSFTDNFVGGIMFMAMDHKMDMKFNYRMRNATLKPGYTMSARGMGDTMLMGKFQLYADDPLIPKSQVSFLGGLSLPTGAHNLKNKAHPLPVRKTELLPYGMQLGSGTYDPIAGVLYQGSSSPMWWGAHYTFHGHVYRNDEGWSPGDKHKLDLYVMYQLAETFVAQFQINGQVIERMKGEADEARSGRSGRIIKNNPFAPYMSPVWDPSNTRRETVDATVGFQWQPVPLQIVSLDVSGPVHQRFSGVQLKEEGRVTLTYYIEIPTERSIRHPNSEAKASGGPGF